MRKPLCLLLTLFCLAFPLAAHAAARMTPAIEYLSLWRWRQIPGVGNYQHYFPEPRTLAFGGESGEDLFVAADLTGSLYCTPAQCPEPAGIYHTRDYGGKWERIPLPYANNDRYARTSLLVTNPVSPTLLLAYDDDGVGLYRTSDLGQHWEKVFDNIVHTLTVDPNAPNRMYLSACCYPIHGIYVSEDFGATWMRIATNTFTDLDVMPGAPQIIYGSRYMSTNPDEGVSRSEDGGLTWNKLSGLPVLHSSVLIDPTNPQRLFAYGGGYDAIWRSEDGGAHWTNLESTLTAFVEPGMIIQTAYINPATGSLHIGLKYAGLLRSDDHGSTWQDDNDLMQASGSTARGRQCYASALSPAGISAVICDYLVYLRGYEKLYLLPTVRWEQ